MKHLLISFSLILISTIGSAQNISVSGKLIDEADNSHLPYATISVAEESNPAVAVKKFATDDKGNFSTSLESGKYKFTFQFVGMNSKTETVELNGNEKQKNLGTITMSESSTELEEISVVAQRPLVKVEIDKLTYNAKEDPESSTSNVLDLLRKVPMVTVDGEDNIQLKGSSGFKIYMNGKPSNLVSSNPSQVLKGMPANSIKDIEVITDPGAKYDAEGVGGIINIVTDKRIDEGYSGSVGANGDTFGGFGGNAFLSLKYGKIGFTGNGSYFYHDRPAGELSSTREEFSPNPTNSLTQNGESSSNGGGLFYNTSLSYEPDTLNLFNLNAGFFGGEFKNFSDQKVVSEGLRDFSYLINNSSARKMGGFNMSADYQRNFKKEGEILTISYRFENSPNDSRFETNYSQVTGDFWYSDGYKQKNINDAGGDEHTGQVDYVNPINKNNTIEVGVKHIFRDNSSRGDNRFFDVEDGNWKEDLLRRNDMDHKQRIASGYLGYTLKMGKMGIKLGARGEHTEQDIRFITAASDTPFHTHFFDLAPSAAFSHQLGMTNTLRWGYNMRISRPGISFLNPYVNDADPSNISYGNPNLDAEHTHNFNLNYGSFSQKVNFNASLSYSLTNNSITSFVYVGEYEDSDGVTHDGVTHNTFRNIGKNQTVGLDGFFSWTPTPVIRMNVNGSFNYTDIQSVEDSSIRNSGISGRGFGGITYTLPKDLRLSANGGIFTSGIQLQTKRSAFYFYSFSATKSLLNKKMDIALNATSPFNKFREIRSTTKGEGFTQETVSLNPMRTLRLSITYRFGDLKKSVRKVERTISNEDLLKGDGGGQQGMGGGSGGGGEM